MEKKIELVQILRKKVNDAIKELGYIKNNLAASIKSDKSHFVAVVVPGYPK